MKKSEKSDGRTRAKLIWTFRLPLPNSLGHCTWLIRRLFANSIHTYSSATCRANTGHCPCLQFCTGTRRRFHFWGPLSKPPPSIGIPGWFNGRVSFPDFFPLQRGAHFLPSSEVKSPVGRSVGSFFGSADPSRHYKRPQSIERSSSSFSKAWHTSNFFSTRPPPPCRAQYQYVSR